MNPVVFRWRLFSNHIYSPWASFAWRVKNGPEPTLFAADQRQILRISDDFPVRLTTKSFPGTFGSYEKGRLFFLYATCSNIVSLTPPNLMHTLKQVILAVLIGVPVSPVLTVLSTPLLWKLESILGIELAGHSGPSDWIFIVNLILFPSLVFVLLRYFSGRNIGSSKN